MITDLSHGVALEVFQRCLEGFKKLWRSCLVTPDEQSDAIMQKVVDPTSLGETRVHCYLTRAVSSRTEVELAGKRSRKRLGSWPGDPCLTTGPVPERRAQS